MVTAKDVAPGEFAEIEVTLSTRGQNGPLSKSVSVLTNDPDQPRFQLTIKGKVEPIVSFGGQRNIDLGSVVTGDTLVKTIPITSTREGVTYTNPTISGTGLSAKLVDIDGQPAVEVTLVASDRKGRMGGRLSVATSVPEQAQIQVGITVNVSEEIVATPNRATFGGLAKREQISIELTSVRGEDFEVTGVSDDSGAVTGTFLQTPTGTWRVTLSVADVDAAVGKSGHIAIATSNPDTPTIQIPWNAIPTQRMQPGKRPQRNPSIPTNP